MSLGSFLSKEIKYGEAALINAAANLLAKRAPDVEQLVEVDAPAVIADIIPAIEKADGVLGPVGALSVNAVLTTYQTEIDAELATLVTDVTATGLEFTAKVVAAMNAVASKLQAEANAA